MSDSASISIDNDAPAATAAADSDSEVNIESSNSKKREELEAASSSMKESDVSVSESESEHSDQKAKTRDFDVSRIGANEDEIVVMKPREKPASRDADAEGQVFSDTDDEPTVRNVRQRNQPIAHVAQPVEETKRSKACLLL